MSTIMLLHGQLFPTRKNISVLRFEYY